MQTGSRSEATAISSGGGEGGHRQGFQRLWAPPGDGEILRIPGTGDLGRRKRLSGGGKELVLGKGDVEEYDMNPQQGGGGAAGVRIIFKSRGAGGADLWIRDLGGHPPHGKEPGGFQDKVVIRLMGRLPRRKSYGKRTYTSAENTREEAGLLTMEDYIWRQQSTVTYYIATRSMLDVCEGSERALGERVGMRWW